MEKITMLGVSESGKTCFIYAMYDFMQQAQNGFTFMANDHDVDLDLSEGWSQIHDEGIWPDGTQTTQEYDFSVLFRSKKILEFSWCDYRGGALTDRSTQADTKELLNRIKESGCLIVCIGADTVKAILSGDLRRGRELRVLNQNITRFAASTDRRVPVIFAMTKADMYTKEEQPKILDIIREYFSSMYVEGSNWLFAIVPVTLGSFQNSEGREVKGKVEPKNIHIPVMFFLQSIVKERARAIQDKLSGINADRNRYRQEINVNEDRNWWQKIWYGDNKVVLQEKVSNLDKEERAIIDKKQELELAFAEMGRMFDVCKLYYDGKPIKI